VSSPEPIDWQRIWNETDPLERDGGLAVVNTMTEAQALVWCNQHGIAAYPASTSGKMLALPKGYHYDALGPLSGDALARAAEQFAAEPGLRLAIVLGKASDLFAFDVDDLDQWKRLAEELGIAWDEPGTAWETTGREGGLHLLWRRDGIADELLRNGAWSEQFPKIEVKGKQIIVAAPSMHENGVRYQWQALPGVPSAFPGVALLDGRRGEARRQRAEVKRLVVALTEPNQIDCGSGRGPEVIRVVKQALNERKVPGTYVTAGRVVICEEVSGSPDMITAEGSRPLPVEVSQAKPAGVQALLADHTFTFRRVPVKGQPDQWEPAEFTPPAETLAAVLAPKSWPGLPVLNGIIGSPVLRPDGTLLTAPGYDEASGLFLASRVQLPQIPARPDAEAVAWARDLLFRCVLGDFRWAGTADRANYVAMLVTQVIRHWLGGAPVPLLMVTATDAGAGKTLLITICGVLFGLGKYIWTDDEAELRKQLTSVLADQSGVIAFDNVPKGSVVRSAVLSKLLTDRTWGDRLLGGNVLAKFANDRLWAVTGNNLRIGGDNRTRTVLVALDAGPHAERRIGFVIGDLESWIEQPGSQRDLMCAVLILVADWAAAGCPLADVVPMRQFTAWARAAGGFCAWHGVTGFGANAGELEDMDDDNADWVSFLARWAGIYGSNAVTAAQLCDSQHDNRWGGTFPTGKGGMAMTPRGLGRRLGGERGTPHGRYVLRSWTGHESTQWWWVGEPS
jgi:hypothetical protein